MLALIFPLPSYYSQLVIHLALLKSNILNVRLLRNAFQLFPITLQSAYGLPQFLMTSLNTKKFSITKTNCCISTTLPIVSYMLSCNY